MSPTLYTAKNNGGNDNGDGTTMVTATTMANNRIGFRDIRSTFPSSHYGAVLEPYKLIKAETVKGQAVLPKMWWDIWAVAWTECVRSCGAEIFCL